MIIKRERAVGREGHRGAFEALGAEQRRKLVDSAEQREPRLNAGVAVNAALALTAHGVPRAWCEERSSAGCWRLDRPQSLATRGRVPGLVCIRDGGARSLSVLNNANDLEQEICTSNTGMISVSAN